MLIVTGVLLVFVLIVMVGAQELYATVYVLGYAHLRIARRVLRAEYCAPSNARRVTRAE